MPKNERTRPDLWAEREEARPGELEKRMSNIASRCFWGILFVWMMCASVRLVNAIIKFHQKISKCTLAVLQFPEIVLG